MIKKTLLKILAAARAVLGVVFLTAVFYIAFAVLSSPLSLFLEKKLEFIYGLF